ncbi:MAG: hypothetical protein LUG26_07475 [Ruminococcus sp.]|nr:hypothetical protein [Ruminococcus sp.]
MPYYNVCPDCGSNLDPGEKCDCERKKQERKIEFDFAGGDTNGRRTKATGRKLSRHGDKAVRVG